MVEPRKPVAHAILFCMRLRVFALAFVSIASLASAQSTWYVDAAAFPPGNGTSQSPYTDIQFALSQSSTVDGDLLLVRPGGYVGPVDFAGKNVTVRNTGGSSVTALSAAPLPSGPAPAVSFVSGEGPGAVFEGFPWAGGFGFGGRGGAVFIEDASPRLRDCVVVANLADQAAIWAADSSFELSGCTIRGFATTGLQINDCDGVLVEDCTFFELGGSRWFFQYWFRDPEGGDAGFNLTDGLEVLFCF